MVFLLLFLYQILMKMSTSSFRTITISTKKTFPFLFFGQLNPNVEIEVVVVHLVADLENFGLCVCFKEEKSL